MRIADEKDANEHGNSFPLAAQSRAGPGDRFDVIDTIGGPGASVVGIIAGFLRALLGRPGQLLLGSRFIPRGSGRRGDFEAVNVEIITDGDSDRHRVPQQICSCVELEGNK